MVEQMTEMLFFRAPQDMKDLIRIRAAKRRISMSDFIREIVAKALGNPTTEESLFLAEDAPQSEHSASQPARI